jgi:type IV pilus assembly protein PilC
MLRTTFEAIASEMRLQEDLRRKVVSALTYPFIIMIFLGLALLVVMTYVIPQIMPIITEMTTDIPFSTRSLVAVSDFLSQNILFLILWGIAFSLL